MVDIRDEWPIFRQEVIAERLEDVEKDLRMLKKGL